MDLDIDRELAVCEAATPGPWTAFPSEYCMVGGMGEKVCLLPSAISERHVATAEFIAAARTGYPEALRRLKRLRELYLASRALTVLVVRGDISIEENNTRYSTIDAEIRQLLDLEETA